MITPSDKPYPRSCVECGFESVHEAQIAYNAQVKHDGKLHEFHVPHLTIDKCQNCAEEYFTSVTDSEISRALRNHLGFLQPEEIRENIKQLGLTQADFANHLGVAKESVSRWITSHTIQNRAMDNLMRLFFELRQVREFLIRSRSEIGVKDQIKVPNRPLVIHESSRLTWTSTREFSEVTMARRSSFQLMSN